MIVRTAQQASAVIKNDIPFTKCVILRNPRSTQAIQARQRIEMLRELFETDAITLFDTSPDGSEANRRLLQAHANLLGSHTLLAIAGGDGTVNLAVDTLLDANRFTPEQQQTTILPLWGGNGNDLAYMLNGAPGHLSIHDLLQTGRKVAVRPLHCEISVDGIVANYTAICYASFGASAYAAHQLEERLRDTRPFFHMFGIARFVHELGMVSHAMREAPRFVVEDSSTTHTVYERLFLNGPRLAKVNRGPLKLTDPQFYHITVDQKRLSSLAFHFSEMRKNPSRYIVADGQAVSFTVHEPTWAQIDGEVMRLTAGTHVRVSLNDQPFYAQSTLLG
ncbi:MAG TPA: diacylglycerol kinase family protein [Verrucomicrobiae bacterium]|nr:diacylglycerol kinase family protein [Verrucomicrobiae bacterium]